MTLIVTMQDGRSEAMLVPEGMSEANSLEAFLHARHPFNTPWVKLVSGEYVRYSHIVAIRPGQN
jgi:hypothetical protein